MGKMVKLNLGFISFINNFLKILSMSISIFFNLWKWLPYFFELTLWPLAILEFQNTDFVFC